MTKFIIPILLFTTPCLAMKFKYNDKVKVPMASDALEFYGPTVATTISFENNPNCKTGYVYSVQFMLGSAYYVKDFCEEVLEAK